MVTASLLAALCLLLVIGFNESARGGVEVPTWADFFGSRQYRRFLELVEDYFVEHRIPFRMLEGVVSLPSQGNGSVGLGLTNLAQACHQVEQDDWPILIWEHFDQIVISLEETRALRSEMEDFEKIRHRLLAQIWPDETLESIGPESVIHRVHLRDTVTVLAVDSPTSLVSVSAENARQWGLSESELFHIGLQNVREQYPPKITLHGFNQTPILLLTSSHICLPANALLLPKYQRCMGMYGCLLGLPHRQVILCHPIDDGQLLPAVGMMLNALPKMYQQGPWSISPNLYWYHDGRFTNLPYESGNTVRFMPPAEFIDLLQSLSGDELEDEYPYEPDTE